jgi:tetratricopeptide (TPR) repeat protein
MGTMTPFAISRVAAVALAATALPAIAQTGDPAQPQTSPTEVVAIPRADADKLAAEMRVLAAAPRDLRALLSAADLSSRLNDTSAALAFLARAETVEPSNARIAAQRAAVLVKLERPGEAMLLFHQAEAAGLPMQDFLADRGLAFDLLGNPAEAQHDYQAALAAGREDETVRRYALSLGISGRVDESMIALDPLLRASDRAAWRARAFILAMNGDVPGAERIAASMMGNMGMGLTPFFRRLQSMPATDRAHAVHFGQLSRTPARLADAQLAPMGRPAAGAIVRRPASPPMAVAAAPVSSVGTSLPAPPAYTEVRTAQLDPLPPSVPVRRSRQRMTAMPVAPAGQPAAPPPGRARVGEEDSILAAIVSGIKVPEAELELMDGSGDEEATGTEIVQPLPVQPEVAPPPRPEPVRAAAKPAPAAKKPEPRKKPEPPKPKVKPEPARIWVQVAGGANEKTLPTTWRNLVKQAPAAFKGKSGWSTPLRATNRVLAGPFKSSKEAQGFVNALKKEKISAFVFTSEAGQKITKLEVK